MVLSIDVDRDKGVATISRGGVVLATFDLDGLAQISHVTIEAAATDEEADEITYLAGNHVSQYVRDRKYQTSQVLVFITNHHLVYDMPVSMSYDLLDFQEIHPRTREMSLDEIREAMRLIGVHIERRS